jgi:zona occludens toxin
MAIVAYTGLPRSGKSYGVVENVVIPAMKAGRHIVTNIPLKKGYLTDDYPKGKITYFDPRDPDNDPDFFRAERFPGAIWVIDEAQLYWPAGTKAASVAKEELEFFTMHGHYVGDDGKTTEIVIVTQNLDQVASFLRNLIQETFRARKLSAVGMSKAYQVFVFNGAQKGVEGGKPVRTLQGKYKPEVYKYYTSHTQNKTDFAAGMEEKADNRNNVFKSKIITLGLPFAIFLIWLGVTNLIDYITPDEVKKPAPHSRQNIQNKPPVNQQNVPVAAHRIAVEQSLEKKKHDLLKQDITREHIPLSDTWRIVGEFGNKLMLWSQNGERTVAKHLCGRFSNTHDSYCVYNGEMVTWYSSVRPSYEDDRREYDTPSVEDIF